MIRHQLAEALAEGLRALGVDPPATIGLEAPARREHGDWSSNVVLACAKAAGRNPRELAAELADQLTASLPDHVERVEIAGPGFVNFHLSPTWLHGVLAIVLSEGVDGYARSDVGAGTRVNVEFVSANPTGPLHAGHGRNAAYGDSVARILERAGYEVERETYINDRGIQMQNYAASLAARRDGTDLPDGGYRGDYIGEWAADMAPGADPLVWGEERALADHRATLEPFNVSFDTWFSERTLVESGAIEATLADLRERDMVYDEAGALWLRSTRFGDDKDRVLVKSDGHYTYLLPDIAYHRDKFARGFDLLIDVWGADHHGYVPRMKAAVQALGHDPDDLEVVIIQLVNLVDGGEPVRLSKRAGDIIELRDVLGEVGADSARLTYLLQSADTRQTFDYDVVKAQANENPVFYVQYAHARIHSIAKVAAERGVDRPPLDRVDLSLLTHPREIELLRTLAELPDVVDLACRERAPHKISTWVRDLAGRFHGFYHDCYVMGDGISPELTQARLSLTEGTRIGLVIGLGLLGVSAPESM
ncbi:MAG TPA: arginine--tRNA ligase [Acidimicrobiales bacterium]